MTPRLHLPVHSRSRWRLEWMFRSLKQVTVQRTVSTGVLAFLIFFASQLCITDADFLSGLSQDPVLRDFVIGNLDYACGSTKLCNESVGNRSPWACTVCGECHCDELCPHYGDCCPDKYFTLAEETNTPNWTSYVSCVSPFSNRDGIYAINRCPENFEGSVEAIEKCHKPDLKDVRQATAVSEVSLNLTFLNEYCALCHGIKTFQIWSNRVTCKNVLDLYSVSSREELWVKVLQYSNCTIQIVPPNDFLPRTCTPRMVRTCNNTGLWDQRNETIEQLCHSFSSPLRYFHPSILEDSKKHWYANVFCILCDGYEFNAFRPRFCIDPGGGRTVFAPPLSVLLDFRPKETKIEAAVNKCQSNEVFDPFQGTCKAKKCSDRRLLIDNQCEPIFTAAQGLGYAFNITLKTPDQLVDLSRVNITGSYYEMIAERLSEFSPFIFTPMNISVTSISGETTPGRDRAGRILVQGRFASNSNKTTASLENVLKGLGSEPWIINISDNTSNENKSVKKRETKQVVFQPKFTSCLSNTSSANVPLLQNTYVKQPYTTLTLDPTCKENCVELIDYVNIEHIFNCPFIEFNTTNPFFEIQSDTDELRFTNGSITLNKGDYSICGITVKVCVTVIEEISRIKQNSSIGIGQVKEESTEMYILAIVSIVCNMVSLVCLLLTFITFALLPKLRTLPGKNTMSLVVYLFLAQLIYLIGIGRTENAAVCQVMGFLIHFLWIASFFWMGLCAFHMYKVFTDLLASRHQGISERTILFRYFAVSNLSALLVVIGCISYYLISSHGEETGYGGRFCFISNNIVIGVAFGGPLALVLILNVFFFVRTIMSIRNIPNMKNSRHNGNRKDVAIYLRLSVLLGFAWIFGFLNQMLEEQNIYIDYIFVILTGCQGLFIFIAFCLSGRTIGMCREKFTKTSPKQNDTHPHTDSTSL